MNHRNPAIKRILADVKELQKHPSSRYQAAPLESDMFEWHFTIRGPDDTAFAGGIYHGRILLPAEYPFKPPNIVFLTKNGRFEVGTKICLSISAYHEETWQPAWGVRTMLEAIISFMPSEGVGAIGALDWTPEERKKLARESLNYCCPLCGPVSQLLQEPNAADKLPDPAIAAQIAQLHMTRQHSETDRYRAGSLISDMSGFDGKLEELGEVEGVATAVMTAEEDAEDHLSAIVSSFENDADNDSTLNQMINMELDHQMESPNNHQTEKQEAKGFTREQLETVNMQTQPIPAPVLRQRMVAPQEVLLPAVAAAPVPLAAAAGRPVIAANNNNDKLLNALIAGTVSAIVALIVRIAMRAYSVQ